MWLAVCRKDKAVYVSVSPTVASPVHFESVCAVV